MIGRQQTQKAKAKSRQVPGQLFGFSLQAIRFLRILLEAPAGSIVTLEVFEDVGLERPDGTRTASQVKSGATSNPLADKSVDLWKTLANWCDAIERGDLDPENTTFEIYIGKPRRGRIANLLHKAESRDQALEAIHSIEKAFARNSSPSKRALTQADKFVRRVLKLERSFLVALIRNFRIACAVRDPLTDLRPIVAAKWVRSESLDIVIRHAHGWIKERLDSLLQDQKPAAISSNAFHKEMLAFLPRCDFRTIITDMAGLPSAEEVEAQKMKTYVRQLDLIAVDEETTLQAINEFLRASVTRTKLSEAGIVHDKSFDDYEEALISHWRNKRRRNKITFSQLKSEALGQLLLSDCSLHQVKLQGLELPVYFTPGSYHSLADVGEVGWHPDYEILLKDDKR